MIEIGLHPVATDWKTVQRMKEQQRARDRMLIETGAATAEQIQFRNSVLSPQSGKNIRIVDYGDSLS